jgi:hypothetical protein
MRMRTQLIQKLATPRSEPKEWPGKTGGLVGVTHCWSHVAAEVRNDFAHGSTQQSYRLRPDVPQWPIDAHVWIAEAVFRHAVKLRLKQHGVLPHYSGRLVWAAAGTDGSAKAMPMCRNRTYERSVADIQAETNAEELDGASAAGP